MFCTGVKLGFLTVRDKHKSRVFENRVLRKIFGPKRDKVTGEWKTIQKEELYHLYWPNIIRVNESKKNNIGGAYGTRIE